MSRALRFLLALLPILALSARAAENEIPFQCNRNGNQQELNVCALQDYRKADAALNRSYMQLMESLPEEKQAELREQQRAWLKARDPQCEKETADSKGGSIWPLEYHGCLEEATRKRTGELSRWKASH